MLIPCPACSRQVSVKASACPGCGHPIADEVALPATEDVGSTPHASTVADPEATVEAQTPEAESVEQAAEDAEPDPDSEAEGGSAAPDEDGLQSLPELSPSREPAGSTSAVRPKLARQIPGSIPAAVLFLTVFILGLLSRALPGTSGGGATSRVTCVTLILGLGLLWGGPGFREWGVFSHGLGILVWPLLLATGVLGPAGPGSYLAVIFNVGILMLLAGEPSRARVRWGVTVAVLGILVSSVAGALFPASEPRPSQAGGSELTDTLLPGWTPRAPQPVSLPAEFGGLTFTVPPELPEIRLEAPDPSSKSTWMEARTVFSGDVGSQSVLVEAYRAVPGYTFDFNLAANATASAMLGKTTIRELSRSPSKIDGKPSLRLECVLNLENGETAYARYQWINSHPHYFLIALTSSDQSLLDSEPVKQLFASVRFPRK